MPEEEVKTVRVLFTDKTKDIPVTVWDSYQKKDVKLNPDGIVSEQFAKELLHSFSTYKIIEKDEIVDKSAYPIRSDYMQKDLEDVFKKLTPNERETFLEMGEKLIADRNKKAEDTSQTQVASEVTEPEPEEEVISEDNGKPDNSTENEIPD